MPPPPQPSAVAREVTAAHAQGHPSTRQRLGVVPPPVGTESMHYYRNNPYTAPGESSSQQWLPSESVLRCIVLGTFDRLHQSELYCLDSTDDMGHVKPPSCDLSSRFALGTTPGAFCPRPSFPSVYTFPQRISPLILQSSVSCVRLQTTVKDRFPDAYHEIVDLKYRGKWHQFLETIPTFHQFIYYRSDFIAHPSILWAAAPDELRVGFFPKNLAIAADDAVGQWLGDVFLSRLVPRYIGSVLDGVRCFTCWSQYREHRGKLWSCAKPVDSREVADQLPSAAPSITAFCPLSHVALHQAVPTVDAQQLNSSRWSCWELPPPSGTTQGRPLESLTRKSSALMEFLFRIESQGLKLPVSPPPNFEFGSYETLFFMFGADLIRNVCEALVVRLESDVFFMAKNVSRVQMRKYVPHCLALVIFGDRAAPLVPVAQMNLRASVEASSRALPPAKPFESSSTVGGLSRTGESGSLFSLRSADSSFLDCVITSELLRSCDQNNNSPPRTPSSSHDAHGSLPTLEELYAKG